MHGLEAAARNNWTQAIPGRSRSVTCIRRRLNFGLNMICLTHNRIAVLEIGERLLESGFDADAAIPLCYPEESPVGNVPTPLEELQIACGDGNRITLRELF
jgi:hypothetical protein